jgi:hypothetical protein
MIKALARVTILCLALQGRKIPIVQVNVPKNAKIKA